MSKPYVTVEMILDQFRVTAAKLPGPPDSADSLLWLANFLAREHATMNTGDWVALVRVGALLWQAHPPHEAWAGVPRMQSHLKSAREKRPLHTSGARGPAVMATPKPRLEMPTLCLLVEQHGDDL
jgi:hypothetical protein